MATMKDLNDLTTALFKEPITQDTEIGWSIVVMEKIVELGNAIMKEQHLTDSSQVVKLPDETILGPKAEKAFRALKAMLPN